MTSIRIGCSDIPRQRDLFKQIASALEHRCGLFSPPGLKVLRRWGEEFGSADADIRQIWVCWQSLTHLSSDIRKGTRAEALAGESVHGFGHLRDTPENRRIWDEIKVQASSVGADTILLETPSSFTPTASNRGVFEHFVKGWSELGKGMGFAWHPSGFWERDASIEFATQLGIELVTDPLVDLKETQVSGPRAYFQLLGRHGFNDSYSDDDLEVLADLCMNYDDVTVIFRTDSSLEDMYRFREVCGMSSDFDGSEDVVDEDGDWEGLD